MFLLAITAAAAGATLWLLGAFGTPRPEFMAALAGISLLGGIVTALLGWRRRNGPKRRSSLICLLLGLAASAGSIAFLIALFWNADGPLPVTHLAEKRRSPERIRALVFNVLGGYPALAKQEARFRDTLAALNALDLDLMILQEAWHTHAHGNMAERIARSLKMDYVYARANGGARLIGFEEGSAVLSRYPIVEARRIVLSPRWPLYETRIAVVATIDLGRETVTLVGTHLTYADAETTAAQTRSLLNELPKTDLLFVAGDFNAKADSPAVAEMLDHGYLDPLQDGIDHLFLPKAHKTRWTMEHARWTLRQEDVLHLIGKETELSDHPAILAEFVRRRG